MNFDFLPNRQATESVKWHYYKPDVLPMWVADMDFLSPEPVIRALRERVEHGVFGYPVEPPELRELLVQRMAQRYNWQITPEDIVLLPGVVVGFNLVCHSALQPGGSAIFQTPVYPPFFGAPENVGLFRQEVELTRGPDGTYTIDFDRFEQAITNQTRVFILCNPHNPVGRAFRRDELQRLAEICLRHKVLICSDEIHGDLIFSGHQHLPIASIDPEIAQNSITLMAPSKTYNIAGLDCSFAIVQNPELRRQLQHAKQGLVGGVNVLGLTAAVAAYREGQPWLDELLVYLEANRDFLYRFVNQQLPGVSMGLPEATYLAWLDCRAANLPGSPAEFFEKQAHVGMNNGRDFGTPGEGFVRMNFACPRAMLEEALARMQQALQTRS